MNKLKFICPECGATEIMLIETQVNRYKMTEFSEEDILEFIEPLDSDNTIWGNMVFTCANCDFTIDKVEDEIELVEWLEEQDYNME